MSHQLAHAEVIAEAIRVQLSEKVNAPGLRALKAVLALQSDASLLQADIMGSMHHGMLLVVSEPTLPGRFDH